MFNRRRLIAAGAVAGTGIVAGQEAAGANEDALIERYAKAMYEAYAPAAQGNAFTESDKWEKASADEIRFGRTYARLTMKNLGLIS